jgi:hypothetical protein
MKVFIKFIYLMYPKIHNLHIMLLLLVIKIFSFLMIDFDI